MGRERSLFSLAMAVALGAGPIPGAWAVGSYRPGPRRVAGAAPSLLPSLGAETTQLSGAPSLALALPASLPRAAAETFPIPAGSAALLSPSLEVVEEAVVPSRVISSHPFIRPLSPKGRGNMRATLKARVRGQLHAVSASTPEEQGFRFDGADGRPGADPARIGPAARAPDPGLELASSQDSSSSGTEVPPPAPMRDNGEERPASRWVSAAALGVTAAIVGPVLWKAAPLAMLFYTAPTAFGLGLLFLGPLWLGKGYILPLFQSAYRSSARLLGARRTHEAVRAPATPQRSLFYMGRGAAAGVAAALAAPFAYAAAPGPLVLYTGVVALAVAGASWAALKAWSMFRSVIKVLRPGGTGKIFPGSMTWRRKAIFSGLGLFAGLVLAVAVPSAYAAVPLAAPLYALLVVCPALWLFWTLSELCYMVYQIGRLAGRYTEAQWTKVAGYLSALTVGAALGAAPTILLGPFVEVQSRAIEEAAALLSKEPSFMENLSAEGRWFVRFAAERRNIRALPESFGEDVQAVLAGIPEGRRVLDSLRDRAGVVRMPRFFLSNQTHSGAFMSPLDHGVHFNPHYLEFRGWTLEELSADREKQRQLARQLKQLWLHELVHAEQARHFRFRNGLPEYFPGQLDHFPSQVASAVSIQLEYEAHIREQLGVHEWLGQDPHDPDLDLFDYGRFLHDLDAFLEDIDTSITYKDFTNLDAAFYNDFLAAIRKRHAALREEGYRLLEQRLTSAGAPARPATAAP